MDKILIGIPVLYGAYHCKEAIESVINKPNVDLLIIDNGAEQAVKNIVQFYDILPNVTVISNKVNIFVNPAWNQIIDYFIHSDHDRLIIMNSDLIMGNGWDEVCQKRWAVNHDEILLPVIGELHYVDTNIANAKKVYSGTPGVFITLNKEQAKIIYPIPSAINIWFGDNWIYEILRSSGYETLIPDNLLANHYWSSTIQKLGNAGEIIEEDKIAWDTIVKPLLNLRISHESKHYS